MKKHRAGVSIEISHTAPAAAKNNGGRALPFTRANAILPLKSFLDTLGSPTQRLLQKAHLPGALLEDPEALLPLNAAYSFLESAAQLEGIDDFGLVVAQQANAFDLGTFGTRLQLAKTVSEYLQIGIRLIGSQCSGQRFGLTTEGKFLRIHQFLAGSRSAGRCQADMYSLAITLSMLRRFIGPSWNPAEVCLMAGCETLLGDRSFFGDAALITGQDHSSFTISRSLLRLDVQEQSLGSASNRSGTPNFDPAMPADLVTSVKQLVVPMLEHGPPGIEVAAEIAGISSRTLQRRLAQAGVTYSGLVTSSRMQLARNWLSTTEMPVAEIAASLGYVDASNFARAFRAQTGLAPGAYRRTQIRD